MPLVLVLLLAIVLQLPGATPEPPVHRRPSDGADLAYWLRNMVWHHRYTK